MELFKRFRDKGIDSIPYETANLHVRDPQELGEFAVTQSQKLEVLIGCVREADAYPRGDYKELLGLVECYIGANEVPYKFLKCGAVHKARWMGKQIYCYKMVMLQHYVPEGIISKSQLEKITRFIDFCTFVFNEWWYNCPLAASAPQQDLKLVQNIQSYAGIDKVISAAALKAFSRHTWYLSGELIPLALWDEDVISTEKENLASKLRHLDFHVHQFTERFGTGFGKPKLRAIGDERNLFLSNFVSADSKMFFQLLDIPVAFLEKPVEEWKADEGYKIGSAVTNTLRVCNDPAERGVKLVADFLQLAKTDDNLQNYMQVVQIDREKAPNLRKRHWHFD